MNNKLNNNRFITLDLLRSIAVISVVMYHFTSRYDILVPVDFFNHVFKYGYFGVHLFFVLSGIVIYNSIAYSNSLKTFYIKRLIRLLPSLVICTLLTFFIVPLIDFKDQFYFFYSNSMLDFLPSIFFIPSGFWNWVLCSNGINLISGSYWSLFPEVVFYFSFGLLFHLVGHAKILRYWILIVLLLNIIRIISSPKLGLPLSYINEFYFDLTFNYWVYFTFGIYIYKYYKNERPLIIDSLIMLVLFLLELYFIKDWSSKMIITIIFFIISINSKWEFLYFRRINNVIYFISKISYPLYLIHEYIGVELIFYIEMYTDLYPSIVILFVLCLMIVIAYIIYIIEQYIIQVLKQKLLIN